MHYLAKLKNLSLVTFVTLVLGWSHLQPAQAGAADPRVKTALDKAGMKYELTDDGDYKVTLEFDDNRSQVVLINSNTEKLNDTNMEVREIYAVGYKATGSLTGEIANTMLKDSQKRKIGAWELVGLAGGKLLAVFNAKVNIDTSADNLAKIIQQVAIRADNMEKELTNKDDF